MNEKPREEEPGPEDKPVEQAGSLYPRQPETATPQSSDSEDSEPFTAPETAENDKAAAHGEDGATAPSPRQPEASTPQSISASPGKDDAIGQEEAAAVERIPKVPDRSVVERAGDPAGEDQAPAIAARPAARPAAEQEPREPAAASTAEPAETDEDVLAASRKHTRRSFAVAAVGAAAGYGFYHWASKSGDMERQPTVLRTSLQANAALSRALFREHALAPTYGRKEAEVMRVNGVYGLKQELLLGSWRMQLVGMRDADTHPRFVPDVTAWEYQYKPMPGDEDRGHDTKVAPHADTAEKMALASMLGGEKGKQEQSKRRKRGSEEAGESRSTPKPGTPGLLLTLADVTSFPHQDLVTQFKCIEGWSQISQWAGVRLADFLEAYPPALINGRSPRYVYMETPNGDYYTGYDMLACRHPQALLVTEMMGSPLTQNHGAPLRLHMPTKYGYKQIKRIGLIAYTDVQPDDYWTRLGYDWYAGL